MAFVIVKPDGTQTRPVYHTADKAIAALKRRAETGAEVVWCKYGREPKLTVASFTSAGVTFPTYALFG